VGNFISHQLLQKLNDKRKRCSQELTIHTIQGKLLGRGRISYFSPTMTLHIVCLHTDKISFMVLEVSTADIILGRPWMSQYQPQVNWNMEEILQWSEFFHQNCLSPVLRTSILRSQSPSGPDQPDIPLCSVKSLRKAYPLILKPQKHFSVILVYPKT